MLIDALLRNTEIAPGSIWTVLYLIWLLGSTLFLLRRRRRPVSTLAWLLAFWTLPLVSAVGYFLFGPRRLDDQRQLRQSAKRLVRDAAPQLGQRTSEDFDREVRLASLARLTRTLGDDDAAPLRAQSIELFENGDGAYAAIAEAIQQASTHVHLEYFIWEPEGIGTLLREWLTARAKDGVQVRVVVDAFGARHCDQRFWEPLTRAGGRVRVFNPPRLLTPQPGKINFRTHRKIVVVDGRIAFTGGINIMDTNRTSAAGRIPWRSTHLKIVGNPARLLQRVFLEDWHYSIPIGGQSPLDPSRAGNLLTDDHATWFPAIERCTGPWTHIVDSGPDEPNNDIHELLFAAFMAAKRRLWITTPYFVPDEAIETALKSVAAQGIDVRLILPAESDSAMVQAAATTFAADAVRYGVEVWLYTPVMNHSKTVIVDDDLGIVGTANLDNRSFRLNFEVVAAVFDRDFVHQLADLFEKDLGQCRAFDLSADTGGYVKSLYVNAMRLLSPLL